MPKAVMEPEGQPPPPPTKLALQERQTKVRVAAEVLAVLVLPSVQQAAPVS